MIIHHPEILEEGGEIRVSSRIEIDDSGSGYPDRLWFRFPENYRDYVTDRSDGFAVALLPLAMALGEKMCVRGVMSPLLALGMREYQHIQTTWHPKRLQTVGIEYDTLASLQTSDVLGGVATAFSGGVDSFYTLHTHLYREQIPDYRISHGLMINGFDFNHDDIEDFEPFNRIAQVYRPLLQNLGVELLVAHTNITPFLARSLRIWNIHGYVHAAFLSATALVLGRLLRCLFIPSSDRYTELHPWGSHPLLDNLLSTETMESRHDGAHASRFEKDATLAQWPEVYSRLRVCHGKTTFDSVTGILQNCCQCEKCLRTMVALELAGALNRFTVFPKALDGVHIRRLIISPLVRAHWIENGRQALRRGRPGLFVDILMAFLLGPVRQLKRRLQARLKSLF